MGLFCFAVAKKVVVWLIRCQGAGVLHRNLINNVSPQEQVAERASREEGKRRETIRHRSSR
jgi:hypothetical protein